MLRIIAAIENNELIDIHTTTPKARLRQEAEVYGYAGAMVEGGLCGSVEARLHADETLKEILNEQEET